MSLCLCNCCSFTCKCHNVTPSTETKGDLLISANCIHFVGDDAIADFNTEVSSTITDAALLSSLSKFFYLPFLLY